MKQNACVLMMIFLMSMLAYMSCSKDHTCDDGKQNQGETGIDCGGPCPACVTIPQTCSDGLLNQTETGVDCGGPCPPCEINSTPTCTDGILNGSETGVDCGGPDCPDCEVPSGLSSFSAIIGGENWVGTTVTGLLNSGTLRIQGAVLGTGRSVVLSHNGDFLIGSYPLVAGETVWVDDPSGAAPVVCQLADAANGTIEFTVFNTTDQTVSGNFSFTCTDINGNLSGEGSLVGEFANVPY